MGCCNEDNFDGGGGSGSIAVQDDGTPVGSFTTLNFITGGTVADGGGGVADITLFPDIVDTAGSDVAISVFTTIQQGLWVSGTPGGSGGQPFRIDDGTQVCMVMTRLNPAVQASYFDILAMQMERFLALGTADLGGNLATGTLNDQSVICPVFRVRPGAASLTVTGFAPQGFSPFTDSLFVQGYNAGEGDLILTHNDVLSSPNNRLLLPGAASVTIPPFGGWSMFLGQKPAAIADGTHRWYLVGR